MKKILIMLLFSIVAFSSTSSARPTAKITVKAIDEQGAVIEVAKVTVGFVIPNNTGIGTTEIHKKGHSDSNGEFSASSGSMHLLGFSVDKGGYYQSGDGYEFKSSSFLLNRWEPWNPTVEVMLKKMRNPVAMYMNNARGTNIPKSMFGVPVGYDLEKGDLVAPYGRGVTSDFLINLKGEERAYTDYECSFSVSFSNEGDGIQEYNFDKNNQSLYKWPFEAPLRGYQNTLKREKSNIPGEGFKETRKDNINYIFRVRTKKDKDGNIIEARYGKIFGEFGFDPRGNVSFGYYFNPDGTRNLEEDPKKNLLKNK